MLTDDQSGPSTSSSSEPQYLQEVWRTKNTIIAGDKGNVKDLEILKGGKDTIKND